MAYDPTGAVVGGATVRVLNPQTEAVRQTVTDEKGFYLVDGLPPASYNVVASPQSASDLKGFGSREWLAGLLDPARIRTTNYFAGTKFHNSKMSKFVAKNFSGDTPEQKAARERIVAALSAEAQLQSQIAADQRDAALITEGRNLIQNELKCTDCHQFHKTDEDATAPNLTGYASRRWLIGFISDPTHADYYGERNDRMPSFGAKQMLSKPEIELIADWLRGTWYEPSQAIQP